MPKCILKNFQNRNNRLFYYDVKENHIGKNGSANSINTEKGYYSKDTERYLQEKIETPFSKLLKQLSEIDFNSESFILPPSVDSCVKSYIYGLIARDPQMVLEADENSLFFCILSKENQRNIAATLGHQLAQQKKLLDPFLVTFAVNSSQEPFILPTCGLYALKIGHINYICAPVLPTLAIMLTENSSSIICQDGAIKMYAVERETDIRFFNRCALKAQIANKCGYVVSPTKEPLQILLEQINNN